MEEFIHFREHTMYINSIDIFTQLLYFIPLSYKCMVNTVACLIAVVTTSVMDEQGLSFS